jgi:PleD family two-component response regulator
VVVVAPATDDALVSKLLDVFVRHLAKDVLVLGEAKAETRLTASCGSVSTTDPGADAAVLLKQADAVQYRAKDESKKHTPRVSAWAVGSGEVVTPKLA